MRILDEYFEALRRQDWERLAACVAEDVHRTGPYLDVVRGRKAYVEFLAGVIPKLAGYELKVHRIRALDGAAAVVELSEFVETGGVRREHPEVLLFEFDATGAIRTIDIYLKQPPRPRQAGG
jgi:hypothetical protein